MAEVALPTITSYVDQSWFLEPLTGSPTQRNILNRFPPEVYNANPESHLARFLYVLIGPAGVGFLRQNALQARLALEEMGLELFDLDAFYGEPLRFTRVTQELYDEDPSGLLTRDEWDKIRARDAQYRSRVLDFLDGVRAGNTPLGMRYVAKSGLGHEVSIVENYKALFDEWSDEPLGIQNYGKTRFLEEMIVLPRREIPRSEVQTITISGSPTGGTWNVEFNGNATANIPYNAPAGTLQAYLESLQSILPGDVEVSGGPNKLLTGVNRIGNPSLETNTTGYSTTAPAYWLNTGGATITGALAGSAGAGANHGSLLMANTGVDFTGTAYAITGQNWVSGRSYVFSVFLKSDAGALTNVQIALGQAGADSTVTTHTITTGYVRYSVVWTPLADFTGTVYAVIRNAGGVGASKTLSIDALQVEEGAVATAYFDGSIPPSEWTGTAHNSVSNRYAALSGDFTYRVRFLGTWSARDVPQIRTANSLTGGTSPQIQSATEQSGVDVADEVAYISPQDGYHLQTAIDRIRPQTVIPTYYQAEGLRSRTLFQGVSSTSTYDEAVRYVTGNAEVAYPGRDAISWIEPNIEHQSPRAARDQQYQYASYHNVGVVRSFTDVAVDDPTYATDPVAAMEADPSNHVGNFSEFQVAVTPYLGTVDQPPIVPDMVLSDTAEPLAVRNVVEDGPGGPTIAQLINGIYPTSYSTLPGVPPVKYDYEQFWASRERDEGDEYLEIDLGAAQAINTVQFETTRKPFDITLEYDLVDQEGLRRFVPVTRTGGDNPTVNFAPEDQNPWVFLEFKFSNSIGEVVFARYLRIKFSRRNNVFSPFAIDGGAGGYHPWSIEVRNLRVGRNITNLI